MNDKHFGRKHMRDDDLFETYEPSEEEWAEIEQQLREEEEEEIRIGKEEDRIELEIFKNWARENGMLWDAKDAKNAEKRKK